MRHTITNPSIVPLLLPLLMLGPLAATVAADASPALFRFPATGVECRGRAVLLAIDDVSLPLRNHVYLDINEPEVRPRPVLEPRSDQPNALDHLATHFYGSVLHDQGRFRMWYYPVGLGASPKAILQGPICYAESDDGIEWRRPNLGQVEYKGSRANNAIELPETCIEGVNVIRDDDDADPERRYKMVYNPHNGTTFTIQTATSPDGIHWKSRDGYPRDAFFEQAGFFKHNGFFYIHGQALLTGLGGGPRGRQGYAWVSPDFDRWLPAQAEAFLLPEPSDPARRGTTQPYDQVHLGVTGTSLGNVVVGLYGLWHNRPGDRNRDVLDAWFGHEKTSCDLGLVVSNDGIHFREPVKGHVFLSRRKSPATSFEGRELPTILTQSNGLLNVGQRTFIYHGRWRNGAVGHGYRGEVALATLPRDRWGYLGLVPGADHGEIWSTPIELPANGCRIHINADVAAAWHIDLADERFQLLSAFSGENGGRTSRPAGLDVPIDWPTSKLSDLAGRTVRLRLRVARSTAKEQPRLFAVYLSAEPRQ